jgi:hypothetical protein
MIPNQKTLYPDIPFKTWGIKNNRQKNEEIKSEHFSDSSMNIIDYGTSLDNIGIKYSKNKTCVICHSNKSTTRYRCSKCLKRFCGSCYDISNCVGNTQHVLDQHKYGDGYMALIDKDLMTVTITSNNHRKVLLLLYTLLIRDVNDLQMRHSLDLRENEGRLIYFKRCNSIYRGEQIKTATYRINYHTRWSHGVDVIPPDNPNVINYNKRVIDIHRNNMPNLPWFGKTTSFGHWFFSQVNLLLNPRSPSITSILSSMRQSHVKYSEHLEIFEVHSNLRIMGFLLLN